MHWFRSEPTLSELLSDPIVKALMAADRVVPEELRENLTKMAGTLEPRHPEMRPYGCSQGSSPA